VCAPGKGGRVIRALDRWAPWVAGVVLVVGIGSYAAVRLGGGDGQPLHRKATFEAAERRVALEFVRTAVARKDLARAWDIAAPDLKASTTREEWLSGTMRVVPYPVAQAQTVLQVVSSFTDVARVDVSFVPKPGADAKAQTFTLDLRKIDGRWLVSAWQPAEHLRPRKGK
jgi:hypothetical protein